MKSPPELWEELQTDRLPGAIEVAESGLWARLRGVPPPEPRHPDMERTLVSLLDDLGSAHRKPFTRG